MRKLTLTALSSVLFLSGCGAIIGAIAGNVDVGDPLALEGTEIVATSRLDSTALEVLSSSGGDEETKEGVSNVEFDDLPLGLNITRFRNEVSIGSSITVTRPDDGFPERFTLTDLSLNVTITDDVGSASIESSDFVEAITFAIDASCDRDIATECDYTLDDDTDLTQAVLVLAINNARDARDIVSILRSNGPNDITASSSFTTESTPELAGGAVIIELKSLSATVRVG
ncbi:MAG: hypothetical protein U5L04_09030 [Trueperaceae bacterium]|nr:hypothetical protein [Trueperaceae bacterium]